MPTKSYLINGRDGAIKLYFDTLWDGEQKILNQNDIVELSWSASDPGRNSEEFTQDGFELIQKHSDNDKWILAGYVQPIGSNYNFFVFFGTYYDLNGSPYNGGAWNYNGKITSDISGTVVEHTFDGLGTTQYNEAVPKYFTTYGGSDVEVHLSFNFPIFDSFEHLSDYILEGSTDGCYNLNDEYDFDETEYYWIYNNQTTGKLFNGTIDPVSGATYAWHSLKFSANKPPVLYYDNAFGLTLKASSIVNSKAVTGPGYLIDNIPEEGWTEGRLEYTGPFYATLADRILTCKSIPENGTYQYAVELNTNIYRFPDKASADYADETGDYSGASNYYDIQSGNTHAPVTIGNEETATTFGSGYGTSPLVSSYICSKNDVINVANAFYTDNTTILDNIKQGLELMGAEPFQCLVGLSWFPFSLSTIATALSQPYIYFGSYQHTGVTVDKIQNVNASGYIDAGTVYIAPLFNSYRDFEPYCQLSVYLPYSGWHEIDIAKYYKKTVNIRYYVDIYTNTFACALVIDNQICDIFNGNIGVTLPICGTNMSEYANSMLQSVLGTVGGTAGGAISGAMLGGGIPGAVIGATVGGFAGLSKGMFDMSQKGQPKDHLQVKGAFSGASSSYMPQYVIFRYDVHDLIVPDNLTQMFGRPSSSGGKIGSFSGFLKCDTIKLNTGRMTDAEINETLSLLRQGIFI